MATAASLGYPGPAGIATVTSSPQLPSATAPVFPEALPIVLETLYAFLVEDPKIDSNTQKMTLRIRLYNDKMLENESSANLHRMIGRIGYYLDKADTILQPISKKQETSTLRLMVPEEFCKSNPVELIFDNAFNAENALVASYSYPLKVSVLRSTQSRELYAKLKNLYENASERERQQVRRDADAYLKAKIRYITVALNTAQPSDIHTTQFEAEQQMKACAAKLDPQTLALHNQSSEGCCTIL